MDRWVRGHRSRPVKQNTFKLINCSRPLEDHYYNYHPQSTRGDTENPLDISLVSFLISPTLSPELTAHASGAPLLPRSTAMMKTVCSPGIGVATTRVAWTHGTGTAAWRSSRSGKNRASGQSDTASAGSLLGPSTQVLGVGGQPWGAGSKVPFPLQPGSSYCSLTCSAEMFRDSLPSGHQLQLRS